MIIRNAEVRNKRQSSPHTRAKGCSAEQPQPSDGQKAGIQLRRASEDPRCSNNQSVSSPVSSRPTADSRGLAEGEQRGLAGERMLATLVGDYGMRLRPYPGVGYSRTAN
ncbi:hypothetical protein V2G26_004479 [Clonostachys chloroleuca]